jgi:hypothetical protein
MAPNTLCRELRQPRSPLSPVEIDVINTTVRQVRWLSTKFGIPVGRAQLLVSYLFETGRRE